MAKQRQPTLDSPSFHYPRRIYFSCKKCALCCGDTEHRIRSIFLLKIEANRIAQKTFRDILEFAGKIEGFEPYVYVMKKTDEGRCVFLKNNACTIYQVRPLVCRYYPFELNMEHDRYVFAYSNECPAIGKGPRVKKEYFRRLFEMAWGLMRTDKENADETNQYDGQRV